jgi:hypothetical protein
METEEQGFSPTVKPKEKWNGAKPKKNPAESDPQMNHEHLTIKKANCVLKGTELGWNSRGTRQGAIPELPHPTQERPQLGSAAPKNRTPSSPNAGGSANQEKLKSFAPRQPEPGPESGFYDRAQFVLMDKEWVGGRDGEILEEISAVVAASLYTTA